MLIWGKVGYCEPPHLVIPIIIEPSKPKVYHDERNILDWNPSSYIYHTTGLGATHLIRSNGVPASQHIDDHHLGQLRLPQGCLSNWSDLAKAASFIAAIVLVPCGCFIGIKKSILAPKQVIPFLGFLFDSQKQAFILPEDKKTKVHCLKRFPALG